MKKFASNTIFNCRYWSSFSRFFQLDLTLLIGIIFIFISTNQALAEGDSHNSIIPDFTWSDEIPDNSNWKKKSDGWFSQVASVLQIRDQLDPRWTSEQLSATENRVLEFVFYPKKQHVRSMGHNEDKVPAYSVQANPSVTNLAFGFGLSYDDKTEISDFIKSDKIQEMLNYFLMKVTLSLPQFPDVDLVGRLHHPTIGTSGNGENPFGSFCTEFKIIF